MKRNTECEAEMTCPACEGDLTVEYTFSPGFAGSYWDPPEADEFYITKATCEWCGHTLTEAEENSMEDAIAEKMADDASGDADAAADYAYESRHDR